MHAHFQTGIARGAPIAAAAAERTRAFDDTVTGVRPRPVSAPLAVALDQVTQVVGWELDAPVVCLSLVDAERRLLTSAVGVCPPVALVVSWPFAKHVVASGLLSVPDARRDRRVARCPAVRDGTVAAYLGVRLNTPDGHAVGTLSVMDARPRPWTREQLAFVRRLCERLAVADVYG